jgi:peptidoglycan/xylan/chitin deacetylase (PgdA/CDA1 family)
VTAPVPPSRFTPALASGLVALLAAAGLAFVVDPRLAAAPLGLFLVVCVAAPFFPGWRFFGRVVLRGRTDERWVALTFDDGPHPATTGPLLDLLRRRGVSATFFVIGRNAASHPDLVRRLLAEGHEAANHSAEHDPLLMLRSAAVVSREIAQCNDALGALGVRPLAFRPPVGIVSPRLWPALREHGMFAVGFSRRARDFGNRRIHGLARRLLRRVRPGDILLLHDTPPTRGRTVEEWLLEVERELDGLAERRLAIRPLAELLGRPIAERRD